MSSHNTDNAAAQASQPDQTPESVQISNANTGAEHNVGTGAPGVATSSDNGTAS